MNFEDFINYNQIQEDKLGSKFKSWYAKNYDNNDNDGADKIQAPKHVKDKIKDMADYKDKKNKTKRKWPS